MLKSESPPDPDVGIQHQHGLNPERVGVAGNLSDGAIQDGFRFRIGQHGFERIVTGTVGYRTFQRRRRDARRQRFHHRLIQYSDNDAGASNRRGSSY